MINIEQDPKKAERQADTKRLAEAIKVINEVCDKNGWTGVNIINMGEACVVSYPGNKALDFQQSTVDVIRACQNSPKSNIMTVVFNAVTSMVANDEKLEKSVIADIKKKRIQIQKYKQENKHLN